MNVWFWGSGLGTEVGFQGSKQEVCLCGICWELNTEKDMDRSLSMLALSYQNTLGAVCTTTLRLAGITHTTVSDDGYAHKPEILGVHTLNHN